ncbi:hypothetical protein LUU34_00847000 [Aix galericulata]|nr:hypothetical protein LUU34_00847000 [Aix galericulata]
MPLKNLSRVGDGMNKREESSKMAISGVCGDDGDEDGVLEEDSVVHDGEDVGDVAHDDGEDRVAHGGEEDVGDVIHQEGEEENLVVRGGEEDVGDVAHGDGEDHVVHGGEEDVGDVVHEEEDSGVHDGEEDHGKDRVVHHREEKEKGTALFHLGEENYVVHHREKGYDLVPLEEEVEDRGVVGEGGYVVYHDPIEAEDVALSSVSIDLAKGQICRLLYCGVITGIDAPIILYVISKIIEVFLVLLEAQKMETLKSWIQMQQGCAHRSSPWCRWRSTNSFQVELDWTPGCSEEPVTNLNLLMSSTGRSLPPSTFKSLRKGKRDAEM